MLSFRIYSTISTCSDLFQKIINNFDKTNLTHRADGNCDNSKYALDITFPGIELHSTWFNAIFTSSLKS